MGIRKDARNAFKAALATWRTANPAANRAQVRRYVAYITDAGHEWLAKRDAQDNAAPQAFADSKQGQFNSFLDALPDVELDPVDPTA